MSTLRSTVTVSASGSSQGCRCASQLASTRSFATCQPSSASRSNAASQAAVTSLARARRGNGQTMSRSGGTTSGSPSPAASANASAAARAAPTTAPSPSRSSGNTRSVVHRAAAAAPAREHSRLISPRCSWSDVK